MPSSSKIPKSRPTIKIGNLDGSHPNANPSAIYATVTTSIKSTNKATLTITTLLLLAIPSLPSIIGAARQRPSIPINFCSQEILSRLSHSKLEYSINIYSVRLSSLRRRRAFSGCLVQIGIHMLFKLDTTDSFMGTRKRHQRQMPFVTLTHQM